MDTVGPDTEKENAWMEEKGLLDGIWGSEDCEKGIRGGYD